IADLWDIERLNAQLELLEDYYEPFSKLIPSLKEIKAIKQDLLAHKDKIDSNVIEVGEELGKHLQNGSNILFEGAQATLLDIDHGIYPFGTSSTCVAAGASSGSGVSIQYLNERIGVVKAYVSRVGGGPVMGELDTTQNPGKIIQTEGAEFGTTTGRPRRVAWLDFVALKYSCRINGLTGLAITKLDVLGLLDSFQVITSYQNANKEVLIETFPAKISDFDTYNPIMKEFPGWGYYSEEDWMNMITKGWNAFPKTLQQFIEFIEQETKISVILMSVGPQRLATFERINLSKRFQ
ncbi:MAG: adenylosuccinate synthetase, partial [Candidatus Hodarchaeales archaeon]